MTDLQRAIEISGYDGPLPGVRLAERRKERRARLSLRAALFDGALFSEIWLGALMFSLGVFIALPFPVALFVMGSLSREWSELACGGAMMATGATRLFAVIYDHQRTRRVVAFCSLVMWLFLFLLTLGRDPRRLGTVVFPALAIHSAWVFYRMGDHDDDDQ